MKPSEGDAQQRYFSLTQITGFDRAVLFATIGIVALILATLLLGDRVGVVLERVSPLETAHATSPILLQFSEPMQRDTLADKLRLEPAVDGTVSWSGTSLIFRPMQALKPGVSYTVVLSPGAKSETGREVLSEWRFSFKVRSPRVAYLAPADASPLNIWMATPGEADSEQQVTNSTGGIYDFAPSPDGQSLAFSETNSSTGTEDIKLLDLETGSLRQLTNCVDASCTNPTWRPDGRMIAYERVEFNSALGNVGASPTRVWLLDVSSEPPSTRPLFPDTQVLGTDPQWSENGQRIAIFDRASASIFIYDFGDDSGVAIPSQAGTSGALSPDGLRLIYPEIQLNEGQDARTLLRLADLQTNTISPLPGEDQTANDQSALWSPNGSELVIGRRFLGQEFTIGYQLYLIDPNSGETRQLTDDENYTNGFFTWDATGDQLVVQRLALTNEQGQPDNLARPEIWTLDVATGELTFVARNAFHPRWIP
ncbi:MAG: PD40 domain-containing protein [Anaerolineae bacterium]|nr:PD40 domain-containing protein [Anaerolineae bacterium]